MTSGIHDDPAFDADDPEALLRAMRPLPPAAGFAARTALECRLHALRPRRPSRGFAGRVADACEPARFPARLLRFAPASLALGAAASVALVVSARLSRAPEVSPAAPVSVAVAPSPLPADTVWSEAGESGVVLPVVNLSDGRAYRPRVRLADPSPARFRAMPGGAIMPVSFGASPGAIIEYSPVEYE